MDCLMTYSGIIITRVDMERFWLFCLLISPFCSFTHTRNKSTEATLFNKLLVDTEYDSRIKPTVNSYDQITVKGLFSLDRIVPLEWRDELLQWDPQAHGNTERIVVPAKHVWLPELVLLNSAVDGQDQSLDNDYRLQIFHDGMVAFEPGFLWQTYCPINLRSFPFDTQTCSVTYINWVYNAHSLNFTANSIGVLLSSYTPNGEWDLVSATQSVECLSTPAAPHIKFPLIKLTIALQRIPTYFVLNILIPTATLR